MAIVIKPIFASRSVWVGEWNSRQGTPEHFELAGLEERQQYPSAITSIL